MARIELNSGEANALVRALVEAKFHHLPYEDPEVLTSSLVARCAFELAAQAEWEAESRHGPSARDDWRRWLRVTPDRAEWRRALANAQEVWSSSWSRWSMLERADAIRLLFAPFECADVPAFVLAVEGSLGGVAGAG